MFLAVLAVLAVGCGGGEEAAELSGPVAPAAQATSTLAPPTTTAAAAQSAVTTTTRSTSGGPTTTSRSPSTTAAAPAPFRPAPAGTYRYDTRGQSTLGTNVTPYPAVTTAVIDAPSGTRQHGTRDLRDPSGSGPVFDSTFEYRADGLYLVDLRAGATLLLFTVTEQLLPPAPVLLLPTGVRPGYHRELDIPTATSSAHLVIDVVRTERMTVGGQAVDTTVTHLVATLPGQYNARLDLTVWLAPANGLWARERLVAEATAAGIPYRSEYEATLQRLTPT